MRFRVNKWRNEDELLGISWRNYCCSVNFIYLVTRGKNALFKFMKNKYKNMFSITIIAIIYVINNNFLKTYILKPKLLHIFLVGHLNDCMASFGMLAYSNLLLSRIGKEIKILKYELIFCLAIGLVWECFAPLIKPSAVFDYIDMFCYVLGGFCYWWLIGRKYDPN